MKVEPTTLDSLPVADSSAITVTIIYDDFAGGVRAKDFAERLAEQLGCDCHLSESFWRSDLLECRPVAEEAARAAAECDYLIVSLRGDRVLPFPTRLWIEAQLDGAARRGASLIVLPDSSQGKQGVVEATRRHFRSLCAVKGVAFFSHAMSPADNALPGMRGEEEADDLEYSTPRRMPGWSLSENHNDPRHDVIHRH